MGASNSSTRDTSTNPTKHRFQVIKDKFKTVEEVQKALMDRGLEGSQMIVGIDFTKSNEWTGKNTFGGQSLHSLQTGRNFYQDVIYFVGTTLSSFDDDKLIPCYGFGDVTTASKRVFSFLPNNQPLPGLQAVLERYQQVAPAVDMSGPTSFGPIITQAIRTVIESDMQYHVLVIIADGQVSANCEKETAQAIQAASSFPLSIILVGVGDGPWDTMHNFDNKLPSRRFDNFQFVDFNRVMQQATGMDTEGSRIAHFAVNAMMELPDQYKAINKLGLLNGPMKHSVIPPGHPLVVGPPPRVPAIPSAPSVPTQ